MLPLGRPRAAMLAIATAAVAFGARADEGMNVCKLVTRSEVESLIGRLHEERQGKPYARLLGQCDFDGERGRLTIMVRPIDEFEETLAFARKDGRVVRMEGVPGHAYHTRYGMMLQPPGRTYFVQVMAHDRRMADTDEVALNIARRLRP